MSRIMYLTTMIVLLGGCAASGPMYKAPEKAEINQISDSSRLIFLRTGGDAQYSARDAAIKIDGTSAGGCEYKGFKMITIAPGLHTLTVDMWDAVGSCSVLFKLEAGKTYYFEIKPRSENLIAGGFGLLGLLPALAGQGIESSGKTCSGAFSIAQIPEEDAQAKLGNLRESR